MLIFLKTLLASLASIFRSRASLGLENLALRHQIGVLHRSAGKRPKLTAGDRKSTRLNSSHLVISYAVFCLKKKKEQQLNVYDRSAKCGFPAKNTGRSRVPSTYSSSGTLPGKRRKSSPTCSLHADPLLQFS